MVLPLGSNDRAGFENFWVGHNSELVTAIQTSIRKGEPHLLYFYGAGGSGKSHLLYAAMRFAREEILPCSYVSLMDSYASPDMLDAVDVHHLVCVDDVHAWAGDNEREQALFALFEKVKSAKGQLLVTANQPPESCNFALRDLVSRLGSGLVYALHGLTDEQQFEAIKLRAHHRGLKISDDTVRYLLSRSSRDSRELFSILDDIDRASLIEKRRITIPFLQVVLRERSLRSP